ncbi:YjhX family toxin [Xinfangfangia pollutisoli]|uniref:YjhX family toxin n=1 Tax=Xinfangfangia pollutisoli TaxID=2865960 RepID=UPI001CD2A6A8|nr:YjhX family toxin [Xinfangfangia pollutisoli]
MNISRAEQRVLHVLALGGEIRHFRDSRGHITEVLCHTRDGMVLSDLTLPLFRRLRQRKLIASKEGGPYRISYLGRRSVRGQLDNQG